MTKLAIATGTRDGKRTAMVGKTQEDARKNLAHSEEMTDITYTEYDLEFVDDEFGYDILIYDGFNFEIMAVAINCKVDAEVLDQHLNGYGCELWKTPHLDLWGADNDVAEIHFIRALSDELINVRRGETEEDRAELMKEAYKKLGVHSLEMLKFDKQ